MRVISVIACFLAMLFVCFSCASSTSPSLTVPEMVQHSVWAADDRAPVPHPREPIPYLSEEAIIFRFLEEDTRLTQRRRPGVAPSFKTPNEGAAISRLLLIGGMFGALMGSLVRRDTAFWRRIPQHTIIAGSAITAAVLFLGGLLVMAQLLALCGFYLMARAGLVYVAGRLSRRRNEISSAPTSASPRPLANVSDAELDRLMEMDYTPAVHDEIMHRHKSKPRTFTARPL